MTDWITETLHARGQRDVLEKLLGDAAEVMHTLFCKTDESEDAELLGDLLEKIHDARREVLLNQRDGR